MRHPRTLLRASARPLLVLLTALGTLSAATLAWADGIDISHWQGSVNWTKVRSDDVTFAFMKATEGTGYADPTLSRNWTGAEQVGIYRSAYHFARPSKGSAAAQARFFVAQAGRFADRGDLPPVLDLETTGGLSPADLRDWTRTWLTTVEDLTGRTPILYFSPYFWIDRMGNSKDFTRYPLWIAHYGADKPLVPGGWSTWTFWQRTSSGRVDGISGAVDMNRFNGTSAELAALAQTSGGSSGPVAPGPTVPTGAATSLTLAASAGSVPAGKPVRFTGSLTRTTPSATLPDRPVTLWSRPAGSTTWTQVATATTGSDGSYALTATPAGSLDYQARFAADAAYGGSVSEPVRLAVAARRTPRLDLRAEKAAPRKGAALMIYGHLTDGGAGVTGGRVRYYKRTPGARTWILVGTSRSKAPTGWHSIVIRPKVTREWRAEFSGSTRLAPRTSAYLTVRPR